MSKPIPPSYKTKNWPDYNKALKNRGSLTVWFDPEMCWKAKPTGKRGRQTQYSDEAIQICLTLKVLLGLPLRQTTGFVESLLELIKLDWSVPDFSTLCPVKKLCQSPFPIVARLVPYIFWWIVLGSRLRVKANGIRASMEGQNGVSDARYT